MKTGAVAASFPLVLDHDRLPLSWTLGDAAAFIEAEIVVAEVRNAVSKMQPFEIEYRVKHKDGEVRYFLERGRPMKGSNGKPKYIDGVILDITARKQAQEERQLLEAQLQNAQKLESIGTLAGEIAHDFNNVLYSIIGYTELTMDDVPEGSLTHSNLKEVLRGAMRAKEMVQQILAFSRKADTEKKPTKIQSVVKETLQLLRASIPSTIEISCNINENCNPVLADSTQIHQMVMNLATNSYHAMRENGGLLEVAITAEEISPDELELDLDPGTYLKLTVRDTGHGIDSMVMGNIFDPYFSTKRPGEGTGMGLAVVHGITKDHGGDIKVHSQIGEGTVFHVYLPLIEAKLDEPQTVSVKHVLSGRERILFVDDEESIALVTQQILERLGYQVTSHTSSVGALEVFRAKPDAFDLVITDMTMPKMNGVELVSRIKEIRSDIPIVICTGYSSDAIDKDKSRGVSAYMMKPIVKDELARTIRQVLKKERGN